ncbi:MAG: 16S rRNA (adenine(1518)-N(6)/adenine(1519)-N(6))-dimethyltransferase RsmA, partial [Actinomycetota bacterium]|nr:16S rRNA (adenine(1518)-N(6)/adenine(1519)-N(6))-dimethyltransferase RsmA [Actinomycetota bacterium]
MPDPALARLLGPADVRRLADRLDLRPTKRLGQNFVHDANTVRRIVRASGVDDTDEVLEVGPGLGSLTLALLPVAAGVRAVEIDPVLAGALPGTVADRAPELADRLTVTTADAMRVRSGEVGAPTAVVANLPYNVAVPVLLHLLAELPSIRRGLVMVQAEVADRLAAGPGSKEYGAPSAKLAWYADAVRAGPVPRAVFWPVPGVDSGLLRFTRRDPPRAGADRDTTFAVVEAAFAQRR